MWKNRHFGENWLKIKENLHQTDHIFASVKVRNYHKSPLKSSGSALLRGSIHFDPEADLLQQIAIF